MTEGYSNQAGLRAAEDEMARSLSIDSLTYLSVEGLDKAWGGPRCAACFDGCYPADLTDADRAFVAADRSSATDRQITEAQFTTQG